MINIKIDLNKLNEFYTDISNSKSNVNAISNQVFSDLKKVKSMWTDHNTDAFIKKIESDKQKIDEYYQKTNVLCDSISIFLKNLNTISKNCNASLNGVFLYNESNAYQVINSCNFALSSMNNIISKLNYINIPSSFKYSQQIRNMKFQLRDINNQMKKIYDDFEYNVNSINQAYRTIEAIPKIDILSLISMDFVPKIQQASIKSNDTEKSAQENLNSTANQLNHQKVESDFINIANSVSPSTSSFTFEEEKSNFQNNSQNIVMKENKISHKQEKSDFMNNSTVKINNSASIDNNMAEYLFENNSKEVANKNSTIGFASNNLDSNLNLNKKQSNNESISFTINEQNNIDGISEKNISQNQINTNLNSNVNINSSKVKDESNNINIIDVEN